MFEKFTIEINLANAAFEDDNLTYEVAAALRELADHIEASGPHERFSVYDVNGHRVGAARFHKEETAA